MKKLLLIVICFLSLQLFAQGNLQFNQVLRPIVSVNNLASSGYAKVTLTVPTGKVWKIESADAYYHPSNNADMIYHWSLELTFGGQKLNYYLPTSGAILPVSLPKWFPEGTYNMIVYNWGSSLNNATIIGVMNVIEFNIIP
jgi:hypothetical protein